MRRIFALVLPTLLVSGALAAEKEFAYQGRIDLGPHPTAVRALSIAADAVGGLYFADNGTDDIYYVTNPIANMTLADGSGPATAVDATSVPTVGNIGFASGSSWQSVSTDPTGTSVYASGRTSAGPIDPAFVAASITGTAPTFTLTQLTGFSAVYTGLAVIDSDTFVAANDATGELQFFNVSGSTATADGAPITGGGAGVRKLVYDATNGKIYGAQTAAGETRKVLVWNSNGTPAGTSYVGGSNPFAPALVSGLTATDFNTVYGQVGVSPSLGLLAVGFQEAGSGSASAGWAIYDLDGDTSAPMTVINGSATTPATTPASFPSAGNSRALGTAFFSAGGNDYLALGIQAVGYNGGGIHIYRVDDPASLSNSWSIYN